LLKRGVHIGKHDPRVARGLRERVAHPAELGDGAIFRGCVHGELIEPSSSLGERIEWSPYESVHGDDENGHDGNPERDARVIPRLGHACNVRPEPGAIDLGRSPIDGLGDDAGIPGPPEAVTAPVT
jgi:hypothetical protein